MENQKTILIVDDQEVGRTLLESILYKEDFQLLFAADGEEAYQQAKTHKPDLILLDVMMPKSDGYQTCQRIRKDEEITDLPIILVTALDDRDSRIRGFEAGANDYISKPIDRSELLARSRNLIKLNEYKSMLNRQSAEDVKPKGTIKDQPTDRSSFPELEVAGIKVSELFTEHVRFFSGEIKDAVTDMFFYAASGKIFGLFVEKPADVRLLAHFQNDLLTGDIAFRSFINHLGNNMFLLITIDRLHHKISGRGQGYSCLVFGEDKVETVFSTLQEESITYAPNDSFLIALQNHMETLFESGIGHNIIQNENDMTLRDLVQKLNSHVKNSNVELNLFKAG